MLRIVFKADGLNFERVAKFVKIDNTVVFPTDTVYGIGGNINSEKAIKKIYEAKGRDYSKPLIVLVSDKKYIEKLTKVTVAKKEMLEALIENFWPGALTIILKKKKNLLDIITAGGETVGVRMPNHEIALKIIEAVGGALPTTSANLSGENAVEDYAKFSNEFLDNTDVIIDAGKAGGGKESTIIDLSGKTIKILREGAISKDEIEKVIGKF